uniref:Uncharacterized protein n=1 Tax=Biomphalaria glabrata TaxID=6526 RepID=A0A2C9K0A0_BIOGL
MCKRHFAFIFSPRTPTGLLIRMLIIMLPAAVVYMYAVLSSPSDTVNSRPLEIKQNSHTNVAANTLTSLTAKTETEERTLKVPTVKPELPTHNPLPNLQSLTEVATTPTTLAAMRTSTLATTEGILETIKNTNSATSRSNVPELQNKPESAQNTTTTSLPKTFPEHSANPLLNPPSIENRTKVPLYLGPFIPPKNMESPFLANKTDMLLTPGPYIPPKNMEFSDDSPVISQFKIQTGVSPDVSKLEVKSACPFPTLDVKDPDIMQYYVKYPRLKCDKEPDWVTLNRGVFGLTKAAVEKHANISCDLYPILKLSDFKVAEGEPIRNVQPGTTNYHDFYRVTCTADGGGSNYENWHAGIRYDDTIQKRDVTPNPRGLDVDVIMIGLDSVSRLAWQRHLPLTRDYFVKVLNGIEMEGYNILGDGTPAALMPILTGNREEDLPEARRGYPGAQHVDHFPWIWKDFRDAGYVTAWGEDVPHLGTFQFRLLGFTEQPTDHYYRYFTLAIEQYYYNLTSFCLGSKPRHTIFLEYMKELFYIYPKKRKWFFLFHSEMSHRDNNFLSQMDEDLYEHLKGLHSEKQLDQAILIFLADHGARFSTVRATAQGKQEERLPYFGIRFPEWFHQKYPNIVENVKNNSKKLVTPFDVHETLHEILNFTGTEKANISKRGVSLFKLIPDERNCDWAHIDPHWCACMEWTKIGLDDPILKRVTKKIIATFNNLTKPFRKECAILEIINVTSAVMLKVKDAVLRFRDTSDGGRGRFGKMDDKTEHSKILYQVVLTTKPGDGVFEVTVTHQLKENKLEVNKKDISRTNKYGNASHCVVNKEPFLRPYCYCKDVMKT